MKRRRDHIRAALFMVLILVLGAFFWDRQEAAKDFENLYEQEEALIATMEVKNVR